MRLLIARIRALFRNGHLDRDFSQELESHLEMLTEDNIRHGLDPVEARRHAAVRLGGATSLRMQHRDRRGFAAVESLLMDLRFAVRLLVKDRWGTAAAIAAIALGIGANTVGFTIVNAALIRGLGFERDDQLRIISWRPDRGRRYPLSYADVEDLRAQAKSFSGFGTFTFSAVNISGDGSAPEQLEGASISANLFDVLLEPPIAGRGFGIADEQRGAGAVALISDGLWTRRYARDPGAIGRSLRIDGHVTTIVGVMPAGLKFPNDTDLWTPFIPTDAERARGAHQIGGVVGRLRDGVDARDAAAEVDGLARRIIADHPDDTKGIVGGRLETLVERFVGGMARPMFITVMGAVTFVLLIACANVANLLLSRAMARGQEIAVRYSLGATRGRIIRQLLIESIMLAAIGGLLGLGIAVRGVAAFETAVQMAQPPYWLHFTIDYRVLSYVAATCVAVGILFGLAPALQLSRDSQHDSLKDSGRGVSGRRRAGLLGQLLVVSELALTIILLCGAGLMTRSFVNLYTLDPGFKVDGLLRMKLQLPPSKYPTAEARSRFFEQLQPRLDAIAGIRGVALTTSVPPTGDERWRVEIDRESDDKSRRPFVTTVTVTPAYFDVLGVTMARGRGFTATDGLPGAENVVISQIVAERFFPGEDPIGHRIRFVPREDETAPPQTWRTIVGMAAPFLQGSTDEAFRSAVVYLPFRQSTPRTSSLLVRSALPPADVMADVRRAVQAVDTDQPVFSIETVAHAIDNERLFHRLFSGVFGLLASIAVVLSAVGIYGVMAYAVSQRTQEIGVRMAMGAPRRHVAWLFLRRCVLQLAAGLAIGLPAALALGRIVSFNLVEIPPNDPLTFGAISVIVVAVAIASCLIPVRRASKVDPVIALRSE